MYFRHAFHQKRCRGCFGNEKRRRTLTFAKERNSILPIMTIRSLFGEYSLKVSKTMEWKTDLPHDNQAANGGPRKRLWWPYSNVIRDSVVLTAVCVGGLYVVNRYFSAGEFGGWLTGENGAIETLQLLILAATAVVGVFALTRATVSSWRTIGIALACIAFAGATREIPALESLPRINGGAVEAGANLSFSVPRDWKHGVILFAAFAFFSRAAYAWFAYPGDRKLWFSPSFIWPVVPFATCFVMAESFEESNWAVAEESIELLAYAMMLTAAVWVVRNATQCSEAKGDTDLSVDGIATIRPSAPLPDQPAEDSPWRRAA